MSRVKISEHKPYQCLDCKTINVFDKVIGDGRRCMNCGGELLPFRDYNVILDNKSSRYSNSIDVKVNVDTTELDIALSKTKELGSMLNNIIRSNNNR